MLNSFYQYTAKTPLGLVGLEFLPKIGSEKIEQNNVTLLESARALGVIESLIQAVEDWLGVALDLEPSPLAEETYLYVELKTTLLSSEVVSPRVRLSLPMKVILSMQRPGSVLEQEFSLKWESLLGEVVISSFYLPVEQLYLMRPGGMLLAPESFEENWQCSVRLLGGDDTIYMAKLDSDKAVLAFDSSIPKVVPDVAATVVDSSNKPGEQIDIIFRQPVSISPDQLLEWGEGATASLGCAVSQCSVDVKRGSTFVATGELLPVFNGYGVLLK